MGISRLTGAQVTPSRRRSKADIHTIEHSSHSCFRCKTAEIAQTDKMKSVTTLLVSALLTATTTTAWQPANAEEQQPLISPDIAFEPVFTATDEILGPEETTPVTTTAPPSSRIPPDHWRPTDRPDPYVCEYLGYNSCWRPKHAEEGPPYSHDGHWPARKRTCVVPSLNNPEADDAPAILAAFEECKADGHIVFEEGKTYYVGSVMNTTGLLRTTVEIRGRLVWSTDIDYWLAHSLPIGFQNQTAAWHLGGQGIHVFGGGTGTLDGNGQVWYVWVCGPFWDRSRRRWSWGWHRA